jgi:DNA invertase Pin-like site-specific DNA recombinase
MDSPETSAHLYLRVSTIKQKSNADQDAENRAAAEKHGWPIGHVYADVGSASRYGKKTRDGFEKLLADLRAGVFARGDVLILWESSRGSRETEEWAKLLNLLAKSGVLVHVTSHGRTYDPAKPRDRRSLDEDGVDSAYESGKTSDRVRRAAAANAAAGRPYGGPTPYGYVRVYDPKTGVLAGQEPDPERAPVIQELFDRIEKGHSLRSIALDFEARGIVSRAGKPISARQLRDFALQAAYAGLRKSETTGQTVKAIWPAIVSSRQYHAVYSILTDPARSTRRPGSGKWLLSLIALCAVCAASGARESFMTVQYRGTKAKYKCQNVGHVTIDREELDGIAEEAILSYVNRPDIREQLAAAWGRENERLEQIRGDLARARAELRELAAGVGAGKVTFEFGAMAEPGIKRRIAKLEAQENELSTPAVLRGLVGVGLTLAQWRDKPMSTRREAARLLLSPEHLGELRVGRLTEQRIRFWKPGAVRPVRAQDAVAAAEVPVEDMEAAPAQGKPFVWPPELQEHATRYEQALTTRSAPVPEGEALGTLASLLKPDAEE